jgi:hypothetical protein
LAPITLEPTHNAVFNKRNTPASLARWFHGATSWIVQEALYHKIYLKVALPSVILSGAQNLDFRQLRSFAALRITKIDTFSTAV